MKRKVIVIGGSGFIGSRITDFLQGELGLSVSVFDLKEPSNKNVIFSEGDLLDYSCLKEAIRGHDIVVHCAAMLGVEACFTDAARVGIINISGTANALRASVECDVTHFLFLSSSEVYGDGTNNPFQEGQELKPKTLYGTTKVLGESMCKAYADHTAMKVSIARMFNVYGPGQSPDFVVNKFILSCLKDRKVTIFGNGKQSRTFTYVDDAARGVCSLVRNEHQKGQPYRVYNIAGQNPVTINELAHTVCQLIPGSPQPIHTALGAEGSRRREETEIFYRVPDTNKALRELSFIASTPLSEGLANSIRWVRESGKVGSHV